MAKRSPKPVDIQVGHNIRSARLLKGLSQSELGRRIGVTFQQVQKYEKGTNRIGASRLSQIAEHLGKQPADFYPTVGQEASKPRAADDDEVTPEMLQSRGAVRLLRAYHAIENTDIQNLIIKFAESLCDSDLPTKRHRRMGPPANGRARRSAAERHAPARA